MKFAIPEISWHNRDPVLSVDFQPKTEENGPLRIATGGTDSHVVIWYILTSEKGAVNLEVAADLTRHQKAVNVVRWSPNGQLLASGDDEAIIFVWKQKLEKEPISNIEQEVQDKESWVIYKTLRGHMEDVLDLSWSPDCLHLASGSVDNKLLLWDISKGKYSCILSDHKGFVQGVAWDPRGQIIATASSDRTFRTFDVTTKKVVSRSSKAALPFPPTHILHNISTRLYHDDTLQTYFRRLQFSPNGLLIAVPAGRVEADDKEWRPMNAVYIYTRYSLKVPAVVIPCQEPALVVRWSPRAHRAREGAPPPALRTARMLLAVATRRSVLLYDTHQLAPVCSLTNIHYTRLTDLSWSPDGLKLIASSTDGFCSVITFAEGELGDILPEVALDQKPEPMEVTDDRTEPKPSETKPEPEPEKKDTKPKEKSSTPKIDSFIKFKAPEKSPKKQKTEAKAKTPVKIDVLEEVAMPSWSDNSNNEIIRPKETKMEVDNSEILVIEDSEDMKLVYEDTEGLKSPNNQSPKESSSSENTFMKTAKVTDVKEQVRAKVVPSPKAPRRVNLITLSSPKNKKKL